MFRRLATVGAVGIRSTALVGCVGTAEPTSFNEGLEHGSDDWTTDATIGPEIDSDAFEWSVDASTEQAASGVQSTRFWIEGGFDDGVPWITDPIPVPGDSVFRIRVSAHRWSGSESVTTHRDVLLRLGRDRPETEEEFPDPGVNTKTLGRTPLGGLCEPLWLTDGCPDYENEWSTPTLAGGTVFVSVGTSGVLEGGATHYVADLPEDCEER